MTDDVPVHPLSQPLIGVVCVCVCVCVRVQVAGMHYWNSGLGDRNVNTLHLHVNNY